MGWNLRVRHSKGQSTVSELEPSTTLHSLQLKIADLCGTLPENQELLVGFPPKALQLPDDPQETQIQTCGISNGDTIVVRESASSSSKATAAATGTAAAVAPASQPVGTSKPSQGVLQQQLQSALAAALPTAASPQPTAPPPQSTSTNGASATQQPATTSIALPDGSCVVRRLIDSDNSCLFNAVGYVMDHSKAKAAELRALIAGVVASDPDTYSEAFLGKPNEEYCQWIQKKDKWGGAIELAILAQHYEREIAAYDIQTLRCDLYGQDAGYSERAMLIYDGLHYDALAVAAFQGAPDELDITMFQTSSPEAQQYNEGAKKLVEAAHKARQFTDVASFKLRCGTCQIGLKGEKEAVEHAKTTGHSNFTEY